MRAAALVCLGAGAGLIRSDLRQARGTDVTARSGGVIVQVRGGRAPRAVPALARYHAPLLEAAEFAGEHFLTGGAVPERGNITNPLARSLAGGTGLPPLDSSRLRATWLAEYRRADRPARVPPGGRDLLLPAAGRHRRRPGPRRRGAADAARCSARATATGGRQRAVNVPLAVIEGIVSACGAGEAIEELLPAGVRDRQLKAGTLLTGMMLALADGRPAHLTRAHAALTGLPADDQARLGVVADWKTGPHQLTYRQVEHTARLITRALAREEPDGAPSADLQRTCDRLLEASIPAAFKDASTSLAADWTDIESWSRPPPHGSTGTAPTPRRAGATATSTYPAQGRDVLRLLPVSPHHGRPTRTARPSPELARRITVCSSAHDPAAALAGVLTALPAAGVRLGDVLADSGYSHRVPATWANPLRAAGASLVRTCTPPTADPREPTRAPSSATDACTAPPPPSRCWSSSRCRPAPAPPTSPPTTSKPPNWPGTSSACTPPATPTDTAASPAPPPPARSAARSARPR